MAIGKKGTERREEKKEEKEEVNRRKEDTEKIGVLIVRVRLCACVSVRCDR